MCIVFQVIEANGRRFGGCCHRHSGSRLLNSAAAGREARNRFPQGLHRVLENVDLHHLQLGGLEYPAMQNTFVSLSPLSCVWGLIRGAVTSAVEVEDGLGCVVELEVDLPASEEPGQPSSACLLCPTLRHHPDLPLGTVTHRRVYPRHRAEPGDLCRPNTTLIKPC